MTSPTPRHLRRTLRRSVVIGWLVAAVAGAGVAVGFGLDALDAAGDGAEPTTTTSAPTATTTTSTTTTTAPESTTPPTTATTVAQPVALETLGPGAEGPGVLGVEMRLAELNIWLPAPDGVYDHLTAQAVMAFQKHTGLGRDGIAGPDTRAALDLALPVVAREGGDHVEIDLERQLLIVVRDGRTFAFNTSTGRAGWRTPAGRFAVDREIDGLRRAPLGDLYRPKCFNGGIAVHGSSSIPGNPASHGCARLSNAAADLLWDGLVPVGTPVWVY